MNIYIQLLLLAWVVVFIVDLSDVTGELASWLHREKLRKPWSCSLCMTWWTGLIWALTTGSLTWGVVAYLAALAFFTNPLALLADNLREFIIKLINKIK